MHISYDYFLVGEFGYFIYTYMKDKIIELRSEGLSYNKIAEKLGCSKSTISYHCSKLEGNDKKIIENLDVKNKKQCKYDVSLEEDIINLLKEEKNYNQIKEIVGLSKSKLYSLSKKNGLNKKRSFNPSAQEIIFVINNSKSMTEAASMLNIPFSTFKKVTQLLDIYKPNQGREGYDRPKYEYEKSTIPINEILEGKYPLYSGSSLKNRLFKEGIKKNKCEICNLDKWNNKPLTCQLDHIDGNSKNHKLENLRIICPNCHSQTETYSGKNFKNKYSEEDFLIAFGVSKNLTEVKNKLNIAQTGNNSVKLKKLMKKYKLEFNDR